MNILVMADVPPNPDSGAAGTEVQTINALRRLGHDVDTVWADDIPHRVRHGNLHYLLELPTAYRNAMRDRIEQKSYDVIHVNQPHGYLAAKALRRSGIRSAFIHRSHGFEMRAARDLKPWQVRYDFDRRPIARRVVSDIVAWGLSHNSRSIARYADGHIVYATQCRDFLHTELGVPSDRIAVIPPAPPDLFLQTDVLPMTPTRVRRVLYASQFAFFKAPMIVAEVINRLSAGDENLQFTWVCSEKEHRQVRELLSTAALDRVSLLGWMSQVDLVRVYDSHGVFLFPSFFEGFGKVFLEAMSRGLCVVAADNSGAHDVISNGADGMLVPTGSVDSMLSSCLRLLSDADLADRISRAAAKTARSYTWDRVARETVAFYANMLEARAREVSREAARVAPKLRHTRASKS